MNWSFQLYSARNFQPWSDVLGLLASLGYRQIEGFGGAYEDPAALRAAMDKYGLSMPTGHFGVEVLESDFDGAMQIADTLGIGTVIAPYLPPDQRPSDEAGWRAFAARLAAIGERCRSAGKDFAWHNHDFEFVPADGIVPMRLLLDAAPEIGWEIDVAWVIRGGADPSAWIDEYASRITVVHVKDIARDGEAADEDGWADVGHGTVEWPRLMKQLREKSRADVFVMEHDNPSDIERFARRSIEAAKIL